MKIKLLKLLVLGSVLSMATASGVSVAQSGIAQSGTTIWDGIYSKPQAARGAAEYSARCVSCHAADLRGNSNSPSLLGMSFMFIWEGKSLGELYSKMRTEMPTDQPGSLPAQTYLDILTYILESNQFPTGDNELALDQARLDKIIIAPQ